MIAYSPERDRPDQVILRNNISRYAWRCLYARWLRADLAIVGSFEGTVAGILKYRSGFNLCFNAGPAQDALHRSVLIGRLSFQEVKHDLDKLYFRLHPNLPQR